MNRHKPRVLHVLPESLPIEAGSTIRSKYIMEMQKPFATPVVAVYPTFSDAQVRLGNPAVINDVKYYYSRDRSVLRKKLFDFRPTRALMKRIQMKRFESILRPIVAEVQPDIIHAASPYSVGIPAMHCAHVFNIPFVYEVRILSDLDVMTGRRFDTYGLRVGYRRRSESCLLSNADAIIAISENLRRELISRGVKQSKLYTILNGINAIVFTPRPQDVTLLNSMKIKDKYVIGFVGHLKRIEGLDMAVRAMPSLLETNSDIVLLIVGDGPELPFLKSLALKLRVERHVIFTGHVSFHEIQKYYSIVDLFILPRIKTKLSDIISPLKPLEAMAQGVPVLGSDVGGIQELIKDGENGFTFKAGDVNDLIQKCLLLYQNRSKCSEVSQTARNWVIQNRNWEEIISGYDEIYQKVLEGRS